MALLSAPFPFLSCPFHSAGSSRTTYVPRASELVATAGRSLDYVLSHFHHHLHTPCPSLFAIPAFSLPLSFSFAATTTDRSRPLSLARSLLLPLPRYPSLLLPSRLRGSSSSSANSPSRFFSIRLLPPCRASSSSLQPIFAPLLRRSLASWPRELLSSSASKFRGSAFPFFCPLLSTSLSSRVLSFSHSLFLSFSRDFPPSLYIRLSFSVCLSRGRARALLFHSRPFPVPTCYPLFPIDEFALVRHVASSSSLIAFRPQVGRNRCVSPSTRHPPKRFV